MARDHITAHGLLHRPNAEMGGAGILVVKNLDAGYTLTIELTNVSDEDGLPAYGDPQTLAAKACSVFLGNDEQVGRVHVHSDVTFYRNRFAFTWVSQESLG